MNQNKSLVSIVICVYNGEAFLKEQIESILNQTYTNLEILILDDQSTDSSSQIIQDFCKNDARIKYFKNEVNLGFNKNFEKGFSLCNGDLIAISDQDDIWLINKIEKLVEHLDDHILIYSNSEFIDERGNKLHEKLDHHLIHIDNPSFKSFLDNNFITGHTCLFKKELLQYALPFSPNLFFYDWWLGFTASYVGKVKYLKMVLTYYRIHNESVIQKLTDHADEKKIRGRKKYLQLIDFSKAPYLKKEDSLFIGEFLDKKMHSKGGLVNFLRCYHFLVKNHSEIYPWYKKSHLKKLNFLRKQSLKA